MPTNTNSPVYQDPRKGLTKLKGINALSESSRKNFEEQAVKAGLLPKKYNNSQVDRLYRDVQYINEFGFDDFELNSDLNARDAKYRDAIINKTAQEVFKNVPYQDRGIIFGNDRIGALGLDSDSLLELMESGYKNEDELEALRKEIDSKKEEYNKGGKGKKLREILSTTGNPYVDAKNEEALKGDAYEKALESTYDNALATNKSLLEKAQYDTSKRRNEELAPEANRLTNYIESRVSDFKAAEDIYNEALKSGNINSVDTAIKYLLDSGIITKEWASGVSKLGVEDKLNVVGQFFQQSEFNPKQIDNLFNKVAEKQEIRDENTGELLGELPGSSVYQARKRSLWDQSLIDKSLEKNREEGANFRFTPRKGLTAHDKLYQWAMWQVAAQKYGVGTAISQLDANLAAISQDNEDQWDRTTDVVINIGFGGLANIMNKVNGVLNLAATTKGEDALSNRLQGKKINGEDRVQRPSIAIDADDGHLTRLGKDAASTARWMWDNAFNPQYWSKVDEYNTLDPFEINRIESLGGISPYTTTTIPGQDIKFFSRKTLDEALKMTKFLWSDYLTGKLVSAPFMWGAQKAGQITRLGRNLGKVGSAAAVLGSAIGIAESYGMMTFDSTYEEAMAASALRQNEAIDKFINEQLSQEDTIKEIDNKVRDISFKLAAAGEGAVNPDMIRQQVINEYKESLEAQWLMLNQKNIQEEKDRALDAATEAYMVDATIEQIRMSGVNALFRKYLFTPEVRKYLGDSGRFSKDIIRSSSGELTARKGVVPYLKNMGKLVFSGFESNYFDDVTVGFGKGFGLGKYNAYLEEKYNGVGTVEAADYAYNFVSGLSGAVDEAGKALLDRQSFYDGFIGGIGVPFSAMPRLGKSERADAREVLGLKPGERPKRFGQWAYLNTKNSLMDAYFETKAGIRNTSEVLSQVQKVLKDKEAALKDIESVISSANKSARAIDSGDISDILDAKNNEAYQLINALYGAKYSPIIDEFQEVKDFLGTLNSVAKGNISQSMVMSFLAKPENYDLANSENREELAKARIQENAKSLIKMAQTITDAHSVVDNLKDIGDETDAMEREQLVYMLAMEDTWKTRVNKMENRLSGKTLFSESGSLLDRIRHQLSKPKPARNPIAEYGSEKGIGREHGANVIYANKLSEQIQDLEKKINSTKKNIKEANRFRSKEDEDAIRILNQDLLLYQLQHSKLREELGVVKENIERAESSFGMFENSPVLTKEEILSLDPVSREKMLVNTNRYSEKQQQEINQLKDDLAASVGRDYMSMVVDESRLYQRIEDNRRAFNRLARHPEAALAYVNNIKRQRGEVALRAESMFLMQKEYEELDKATTPEELFSIAKDRLTSKNSYLTTPVLESYMRNSEDPEILVPLLELSELRDNIKSSIDTIFKDTDTDSYSDFRRNIQALFADRMVDANSAQEAMASLEDMLDEQTDERIKKAFNQILDNAAEIGVQRDATKQRNREEERKRKEEAARKEAERLAKLDGKNYHWDGFKVGDTVYDSDGNFMGIVSAFEVTESMCVEKKNKNGVTSTLWLEASKFKDKVTKEKKEEKPIEKEEPPVDNEVMEENPSNFVQVSAEDIDLTPIDEAGETESPDVDIQAKAEGKEVTYFTDSDASIDTSVDPQESLPEVLPGNRYQQYSYEALKEGIVVEEVPTKNSDFAQLVSWLHDNNIRLQEIIDKEFARVIREKSDTKIRFMMLPTEGKYPISGSLEAMLINVIEFNDIAKKYHIDKNGGVITDSKGKQWLVVGTTGFAKNYTKEQWNAYMKMKAPISERRLKFFEKNPNAKVYVDDIAYSTVKHFTSGNLVKQTIDMDSMSLRPVSELMKMHGKTLEQAEFGIQTRKPNGQRGFATTSSVKSNNIYPPRDSEGNMGRVFILVDTPNGNKIPAYIEAPMFNSLEDGTPLKNSILRILNEQILNPNYEVRAEGIKRLCGYLVLKKDGKNILIGNKDINTVTLKVMEKRPTGEKEKSVTFDLKNFGVEERQRFFNELNKANFEVNTTLRSLNDVDILKMYDDSGALMTNIASLETSGSTYTILPVGSNGKPIETVNQGNKWGTGRATEMNIPRRTARVNNTDYEFNEKDNVFFSTVGDVVTKKDNPKLWSSLYLNLKIKEGNWSPVLTRGLVNYYKFPDKNDNETVAKVDNLGNAEFIVGEEREKFEKELLEVQKEEFMGTLRNNLQDIDLGEEKSEEQSSAEEQVERMQRQILGEKPVVKEETKKESNPVTQIVKETKEKDSTPISTTAEGASKGLLNSEESGTFTLADAMGDFMNPKFDELAEVLESKGLSELSAEEITKKLNLPKTFKDIDTIIDIIRNCR